MIIKFNNDALERIFSGEEVSGKQEFSSPVIRSFKKTILLLEKIENVSAIWQYKGLNFKKYKDFYSVRVNDKYRLLLTVEGEEIIHAETLIIEELTNHYS